MARPEDSFWLELFPAGKEPAQIVSHNMRAISRHGRPFLLVPAEGTMAAAALALYPAQKAAARALKALLTWSFRRGFGFLVRKVRLDVDSHDPVANFLNRFSGQAPLVIPPLAICAGNPGDQGRRFVVLVFDAQRRPAAVVKVGLGTVALELIQK